MLKSHMENTEFIDGKVYLAKLRLPMQHESTNHSIFSSKLTNHTFSIAEKQIAGDSFGALLFLYTVSRYISFPSTPGW
ncbi:hypothetical protein CEXT_138061 [Caerostris extrusa]|uniref:Uncharacterized protein n=1 Tax=Caerostris extrusa TaxID=172846 RepID=A0AAV4MXC2_CAEEX|nr:hypothetical protein CEXT_138061 [Caerostris extrusa]